MPFNQDFGPLNLAHVHRYCRELARLLSDQKFEKSRIFHYCGVEEDKMANAAFLMGAFMIIVLKLDAESAFSKFKDFRKVFKPYRDASKGACHYECTILHCLRGLQFAIKQGWYDFRNFNIKEYEKYERVDQGDLNWIIPGKFVAFMGPVG